MHMLGLLGMTRRIYTYPNGMGWGAYNLSETIGAFILTAGLLMIFGNLAWSRFRGPMAGPDPFGGGTLEWATTSPPPPYNFPVIPVVRSAYPNWDVEDRQADRARLRRGELVFDEGHETPAATVVDAVPDEVLEMPSESPWPLALAGCAAGLFVMLLVRHYVVAGVFALLAILVLGAWHWKEPQEK